MSLSLDRMEIESVGSDPKKLADALLQQLPDTGTAIPIDTIARALDIVDIRLADLVSIEGCLQCDALKNAGQIVVNATSSPRRRRYTIAHELGHFLNERHRPTLGAGFMCTSADMAAPSRTGRHQLQEQQANTFAIEVLTPRASLRRFLRPGAELNHALSIAETFDISREAAIRRYVDLSGECLAAVFSKDGQVRYVKKSEEFPRTTVWVGDALGHRLRREDAAKALTNLDEADPSDWIAQPKGKAVFSQSLLQKDGYAVTLLVLEDAEGEFNDEPKWR